MVCFWGVVLLIILVFFFVKNTIPVFLELHKLSNILSASCIYSQSRPSNMPLNWIIKSSAYTLANLVELDQKSRLSRIRFRHSCYKTPTCGQPLEIRPRNVVTSARICINSSWEQILQLLIMGEAPRFLLLSLSWWKGFVKNSLNV